MKLGKVDIIIFMSFLIVISFVCLFEGINWREWIKKCIIVCIGFIMEKEVSFYFLFVIVLKEYIVEVLL